MSKKKKTPENAGKVFYLSGPESLTDLSIAITVATNTGKYGFLLIDSLSTLLIYNDAHNTQKFAHYLISKMSSYGMTLAILTLDEDNSIKVTAYTRSVLHQSNPCMKKTTFVFV